ncbi:hypothetical protein ZIOFF_033091 [Zingiber officinale]|uniref:Uncharacterized protein n=1 Tax=Zingiber officinale TaxID=94328 RepID=A0A8J5L6U3_ZINOF|nr:hypothetical protein ZIOFF_033091 [Zingiber officinale]
MGTRSSTCEKTSVINFGSLEAMLVAGSTQATRFAAAKQIGDIAKSHPQELNSLLKKVSQYLRSKNWDTRVAAAHAVGAIAENVKHISLKELLKSLEVELAEVGFSDASRDVGVSFSNICPDTTTGLSFKSFDINKVLEFGSPLLASGGQWQRWLILMLMPLEGEEMLARQSRLLTSGCDRNKVVVLLMDVR